MKQKNRRRLTAVGTLGVVTGTLVFLAYGGIEENLVYLLDVDQLLQRGEGIYDHPVRLGGMVQTDSYTSDPDTLAITFRLGMSPESGDSVLVEAKALPSQMFREGIGTIVEGSYDGKVFRADRIIVKHNNEYKPPQHGERPEELLNTLAEDL